MTRVVSTRHSRLNSTSQMKKRVKNNRSISDVGVTGPKKEKRSESELDSLLRIIHIHCIMCSDLEKQIMESKGAGLLERYRKKLRKR